MPNFTAIMHEIQFQRVLCPGWAALDAAGGGYCESEGKRDGRNKGERADRRGERETWQLYISLPRPHM